ncbi:MAG: F0F1 ATP synthase subunit delta [Candidatus Zixiibacteriota bacterium]|nr:MAG: F0F1 ATP synthase subunit delta [candidate division Zixibacteria bacterium]
MIAQEVAHKYATALFRSVRERGLTDQAYEQFRQLRELLAEDDRLERFLLAPEIPMETKLATVRRIFENRLERLFVEFLDLLVEKHRVKYLSEIIDAFLQQIEEAKGILRATVITAVPLSAEEEQKLIARLSARFHKTILLEKKVEPKTIGGMIIMVAGEIIDGSIRHGLDEFREQLQRVRV